MPKLGSSTSPRREILLCKQCGAEWKYEGLSIRAKCPYCGKVRDSRKRYYSPEHLASINSRCNKNPKQKDYKKASWGILKKRCYFKITGKVNPICARCGCNDIRLLEINHKNGGGAKERKEVYRSNEQFYRAIVNGEREVDDLEFLCRPCNAIHYLEIKFGKLPIRVVWEP